MEVLPDSQTDTRAPTPTTRETRTTELVEQSHWPTQRYSAARISDSPERLLDRVIR